jgi:kynureninase
LVHADPPERFQSGTPNVPALYAGRAGYEIVREIGVEAIRAKSLLLTRRLIDGGRQAGFRINTPDEDRERGGTVILDVPNAAVVTDQLIARGVIVDYRPEAGIRIAPHFYTTMEEIEYALQVLIDLAHP